MRLPECPMCKTDEKVVRVPDCSCHAEGSNGVVFYSDIFVCESCGGDFYYNTESVNDEIFSLKITYKKRDCQPNVRVV